MPTLAERLLDLLKGSPGLTDRQITDRLVGRGAAQQPINQTCRGLESRGLIARRKRPDGLIGNYLDVGEVVQPVFRGGEDESFSEDWVKRRIDEWLRAEGWQTTIALGGSQGIDIDAKRGTERWIIEVKGEGSRPQMRVNYFLAILGEVLQRMDDPSAQYSIALPDLPQYRRLWERLPALAKSCTRVTALFVDKDGKVIWKAP